jgi:hypothetical protein
MASIPTTVLLLRCAPRIVAVRTPTISSHSIGGSYPTTNPTAAGGGRESRRRRRSTILSSLPEEIVATATAADAAPPKPPRRRFFSSRRASSSSSSDARPRVAWLDLRGAGLSVVERLAIDELLLRHDPDPRRSWAIVGTHEPTANRILEHRGGGGDGRGSGSGNGNGNGTCAIVMGIGGKPESLIDVASARDDGVLVLRRFTGGGTVVVDHSSLLTTLIMRDSSLPHLNPYPRDIMGWTADAVFGPAFESWGSEVALRRRRLSRGDDATYSGAGGGTGGGGGGRSGGGGGTGGVGGGRRTMASRGSGPSDLGDGESMLTLSSSPPSHPPSSEMERRQGAGRRTLVFRGKSCGISGGDGISLTLPPPSSRATEASPSHPSPHPRRATGDDDDDPATAIANTAVPTFRLRENDYVIGDRKIGGNAQGIVKGGFLHHTSFLWDWEDTNMDYLTLPHKRPTYRGDRSHDKFLIRLRDAYGSISEGGASSSGGGGGGGEMKNSLFVHMKKAICESFRLEDATLRDALDIANDKFGGLQGWFDGKCRTKVVKL